VASQELPEVFRYDYAVLNDELEAAVGRVLEIVHGEREGRGAELALRFGPALVLQSVGGLSALLASA
jgi:hypothetical protein